jgi:high frequency lysogenization protein
MMNEKNKNQVLALAGILQTADLVNELAAHGNCNQFAFETSIKSIYALEAADLKEIYGYKIEGLTLVWQPSKNCSRKKRPCSKR